MPLSLLGFVFLAYLPEGLGKLEELPPAVNYPMRNGGSGEGPEIAEGRKAGRGSTRGGGDSCKSWIGVCREGS